VAVEAVGPAQGAGEAGVASGVGGGGSAAAFPPPPPPGESDFGGGRGAVGGFAAGSGYAGGGGGGGGLGGGVFVAGGRLLATGSRWAGNHAKGGNAGGTYTGGEGGGGFGAAVFSERGSIQILDCLFDGNTCEGALGAGGHAPGAGGAAGGGGIFVHEATAVLSGSTFTRNAARAADSAGGSRGAAAGGRAYSGGVGLWGGYGRITNCTFSGNLAYGGRGGALDGGEPGGAARGGGLLVISNTATVVNCTLVSNQVVGGQGGMASPGYPAGPRGEELGGGFHHAGGFLRVLNSIVSGNSGSTAGVLNDGSGIVDSLGFNLFGSAQGMTGMVATDRVGLNPGLAPLSAEEGPTPVHALLDGSPAIDAGALAGAPSTDSWGVVRPAAAGVDLGAFERVDVGWKRAWVLVDGAPGNAGGMVHAGPAEVAVRTPFVDGRVFYTLDDSTPSESSIPYTGPFGLARSATVRAIAMASDGVGRAEAPPVPIRMIPPGLFSLRVTQSGEGLVQVDPPEGPYPAGSTIRLTAVPMPRWNFAGWSGDGGGFGRYLEVTVNGDLSVGASFTPFDQYQLRVTVEGVGQVMVDPPGPVYLSNSVVRLTATNLRGPGGSGYWSFAEWLGVPGGNALTNTFVMDRHRDVTARFAWTEWNPPRFYVNAWTEGGGRVEHRNPTPAPGAYPVGSTATLVAIPDPGWEFLFWMGDISGTSAQAPFEVERDVCAVAVFGAPIQRRTLAFDGGAGSLELEPDLDRYAYGSRVRITALPSASSYVSLHTDPFVSTVNPPVELTMTQPNSEVRAFFGPLPPGEVLLTPASRGRGRIVPDQAFPFYRPGQTAVLVPEPEAGQMFLGWSGDVTGTQPELAVVMDRSKTVIGTFSWRPGLSWVDGLGYGRGESLRLQLAGQPGTRCVVESSADLQTWAPLRTVDLRAEREILGISPGVSGSTIFFRAVVSPGRNDSNGSPSGTR
jgi:hypothetical protein